MPGHRPQAGAETVLTGDIHPGLGFKKISLYFGKTERFYAVLPLVFLKG